MQAYVLLCLPCVLAEPSHIPDVAYLLDDIVEWKVLGLRLGLPFNDLEAIKHNNPRVIDCKLAMLHQWLRTGRATRQSLVSALREMGENQLAYRVLTNSVAGTDPPPDDIASHILTEETLGKINFQQVSFIT